MAQWSTTFTSFTKDSDTIISYQYWWLTIPCNYSSKHPTPSGLDRHLCLPAHTHTQKHTLTHNHRKLIFKTIKQHSHKSISLFILSCLLCFDDGPCIPQLPFWDGVRLWLRNVICRHQLDHQSHPWSGPSIPDLRYQTRTNNTVAACCGLPGTDS